MQGSISGTLRKVARLLSLGLAVATTSLVLITPPANALPFIGGISTRLTIFDTGGSCGFRDHAVNVHGFLSTKFGSGQELIDAGYRIKIEGWGEDPIRDNRVFGPSVLRGSDLTAWPAGMSYNLRRCIPFPILNEDTPDSDEIYVKVWLLDRNNNEVRNIESNTIRRQFAIGLR
jgi:hypothetical protein